MAIGEAQLPLLSGCRHALMMCKCMVQCQQFGPGLNEPLPIWLVTITSCVCLWQTKLVQAFPARFKLSSLFSTLPWVAAANECEVRGVINVKSSMQEGKCLRVSWSDCFTGA